MPLLVGIDGVEKMSKSLGQPDRRRPTRRARSTGARCRSPTARSSSGTSCCSVARWPGGSDPLRGQASARARADRDLPRPRRRRPRGRRMGPRLRSGAACRARSRRRRSRRPTALVHLPALIAELFDISRSQARRLIAQGGVSSTTRPSSDVDVSPEALDGRVLRVGKRRFVRLRAPAADIAPRRTRYSALFVRRAPSAPASRAAPGVPRHGGAAVFENSTACAPRPASADLVCVQVRPAVERAFACSAAARVKNP